MGTQNKLQLERGRDPDLPSTFYTGYVGKAVAADAGFTKIVKVFLIPWKTQAHWDLSSQSKFSFSELP